MRAYSRYYFKLKSSQNKKDLNEVTAAPFLVSFSQLLAAKQNTQNGAAVTSVRSFIFPDDFRKKCQAQIENVKNQMQIDRVGD